MARLCPDCQITLNPHAFHGVKLDVCSRCAGIWFDAEELRTLITSDPLGLSALDEQVAPHLEQAAGPRSLHNCPDCGMLLQEFHYLYNSPIVLLACPKCEGFWVRDGELLKIQQWRDRYKGPMSLEEAQRLQIAQAQ